MNHIMNTLVKGKLNKAHIVSFLVILSLLSACSSLSVDLSNDKPTQLGEETENWKAFNRDVYHFNKSIDSGVVKPIAKIYKKLAPEFIDTGISNVFSNLKDVPNALNAVLQLKPKDAVSDAGRFVVNSTIGLAGFIDVATKMELPKHDEDFGQTLAVWGVPSGDYVVLPVLGPSTVRDSFGKVVDTVTNPSFFFDHASAYFVVDSIDKRADLLSVEASLKGISDDDYDTLRTAWLQQRRYLINDGKLDDQAKSEKKSLIDELEDLD